MSPNIWLSEALTLVPEQYGREELREHLTHSLKRCHARSKKTFWQWLRITLAKTPETAEFLEWMVESKLPPEVTPAESDDFEYTVNGDVVLIPVGDETAHGVWKLPLSQLSWARSMFPVFLKQLPDLEPVELLRQREIKHRLRYLRKYLTQEQLASLKKEIDDLDARAAECYKPVPRYCLMKSTPKRDVAVHRLFIAATEDDEVTAVNGDFLNFYTVKIRMTLEPVIQNGVCAAQRSEPVTREITVNNLQIVPMSAEHQEKFEAGHLQYKATPQGDISERTLRLLPNADLGKRTGVNGRVEDCGRMAPLSAEEQYAPERFTRKPVQRSLNPDVIRRRWRGL